MARISNTSIYPNIDPVLSDYFVLTDANDDLSTKTCTLEALQKLYNVLVRIDTKCNSHSLHTWFSVQCCPSAIFY